MAHSVYADDDKPSLLILLIDSLAFFVRNQMIFWIAALPIAGLAAGAAYVLEADQKFVAFRNHWGWDFLFALIYAMFLDRWIKETLLADASPSDEVDNLRRSIVAVRFLAFAAALFVLAMALNTIHLQGIAATLHGWQTPHAFAVIVGGVLSWLPHLLVWATVFTAFVLMLPALSAAEPISVRQAMRLGRPIGGSLFTLVFCTALVSLSAYATTQWGLEVLPKKPWAAAAMAGAWRLFDCLLLALAGYVLAALWRQLTDWQQPEPEDHPFRNMRLRPRPPR
ncbi:MAG: hypothetical protein ACHQK9_12790 [Reyranellales bacterium]